MFLLYPRPIIRYYKQSVSFRSLSFKFYCVVASDIFENTFPMHDYCFQFKPKHCIIYVIYIYIYIYKGTAVAQWLRCCAKIGRSLVRSQLVSLEFFIDIKSFRSKYGPGVDSTSNINEYQEHFLGIKAAGAWGWQPYHHPVPLLWNMGTLTSWNPLDHSRPVKGLLYLVYTNNCNKHLGLNVPFASL